MRVPIFVCSFALAASVELAAPAARVTAIDPADKIQPSAYRAARWSAFAPVVVYFNDGVSFEDARAAILAAGGALDDVLATRLGATHELSAKLAAPSLSALAADQRVLMIGGPRH